MSGTATILRVAVSFVLAADAVAVLVALAGLGTIMAAPGILHVTGAITLFIATPAYVVLRLYRRETWRSCVAAGFLIGAIVVACVVPDASESAQIGREVTVVVGVGTAAGWRMYAEGVCIAGGIGAGAGSLFWAVLRLLERGARWPRLRRLPLTLGNSMSIAASWTIFAIPSLSMDRSCHNMLRDGRDGISPVLFFTVELTGGEWPRFQDMAESFAANERWTIDKLNAKDKAFSHRRFVSACIEPAPNINFDGADLPGSDWVMVSVFQPQGGDSWREPARRLLASIEAAFPGRLRRTVADTKVQSPATLLP